MSNSLNFISQEICEIGKRLYDKGFVPGSSGNISYRIGNDFLISPSGSCLGELSAENLVMTDMEGNSHAGKEKPSSERFMHIEIYKRRPDVNCIIHAHPPKSTAISVAGMDLKEPLIAEAVISVGDIPLVKYETPSTHKLAADVADHFIDHDAVLMANHGVTTCGKDLKKTFYKMETIEFLSEIYLLTGLLGKKNEIPAEKVAELIKIREKTH